MTRLSVALWRGNSRLLRALHAPPAEDLSYGQYIAEDGFAADGEESINLRYCRPLADTHQIYLILI